MTLIETAIFTRRIQRLMTDDKNEQDDLARDQLKQLKRVVEDEYREEKGL